MSKQLLLLYAYDDNNNLVHIDNAQKGNKYTCPSCGAELILRKSKIPEGQKYHKRNHFAHKGNSDNHCSESFLHKLFKEKCAEYINEKILKNENFFFEWKCEKCYEIHKGNLLKKTKKAVTEYHMGVCKPDIALLDENDKVVITVEIVVTHKPEPNTLQYYNDNKIACLQINVEDFIDCDNIETKLSHPDNVNICPNPTCKICGGITHNVKLVIAETTCWKCHNKMLSAFIHGINGTIIGKNILPTDFNKEELEIAKTLGANIQKRYSKEYGVNYFTNVCQHCNSAEGLLKHSIYDYYNLKRINEIDLENCKCFDCIDKNSLITKAKKIKDIQSKVEYLSRKLRNNDDVKKCPKCGNTLKLKSSKYGAFWGCKNFPRCKYTETISNDVIDKMYETKSLLPYEFFYN